MAPPQELEEYHCDEDPSVRQSQISEKSYKEASSGPSLRILGPIERRNCTDVVCLLIFLAFLAGWITLAVFAYLVGVPKNLMYPTDSQGRVCGTKTKYYDLSDKPYLFFFDLTACFGYDVVFTGCPTQQVCVTHCPSSYFYLDVQANFLSTDLNSLKTSMICAPGINPNNATNIHDLQLLVLREDCAGYYLDSVPMAGRCVPRGIIDGWESISGVVLKDTPTQAEECQTDDAYNFVHLMLEARSLLDKILADLQIAWWQILTAILLASLLAFIWIYIMHHIAAIVVWLSIILTSTILLFLTLYSSYKYFTLKSMYKPEDYRRRLRITNVLHLPKTWLILGIGFGIIFVIFSLCILCLINRIRLAVALIAEASKAVKHIASTLIFPIVPFVLHLSIFLAWASVATYLASTGKGICSYRNISDEMSKQYSVSNGTRCHCITSDSKFVSQPLDNHCHFDNYTRPSYVFWAQMFNLFGFFWLMSFVSGFSDMVLAGAFASYYWALKKPHDVPFCPVTSSIKRTIRFHLGSIAFGSLILAIVKFVRIVIEYIAKKFKGLDPENLAGRCCLKFVGCLLWFLEKFVQFINKNAYIMTAVYGYNFCKAARDAFTLLAQNVIRVIVLNKLTDFLIALGKMIVTFLAGFGSYYYFTGQWLAVRHLVERLNYPAFPIVMITVATYAICCSCFSVYNMAVDTTFLCFLKDCQENDGSSSRPYYMSRNLMNILQKKNVEESDKEKA